MKKGYYKLPVCVLSLLIKNNTIYLLLRSKTGWADECYAIPGGALDPNESLKQACAREAYEELGVTIAIDDLEFVQTSLINNKGEPYLMCSFAATKWQGEPKSIESQKHSHGAWFELNSLPKNLAPFAQDVIDAYKNKVRYKEYGW